jgi:O-antigen ligase
MINRGFVFKLFILSTAFLLIFNFRDEFVYFVQDFNDYSTSERIKLYEAAFSLWKEAPVVGWGWGSTSEVVPKIYTIGNEYPHFHSTYAQLIVELGFLGIIIIIIFLSACLMNIKDGLKKIRTGVPIGVYQIFISLAIFGSGFSEAIVFGADRAIPLMLSLAIMHKIAFNWKH